MTDYDIVPMKNVDRTGAKQKGRIQMPISGSQITICDLPIRYDTYRGCTHGCKYCFARKKTDIENIDKGESIQQLKAFIEGQRNSTTCWCDWDIPLHWGGMSDPFQPCEKQLRYSYEALKLLAETKYPFVVSTKGKLITDPEYITLIKQCNCVIQISMACALYDKLEPGAPSFEERMEMLKKCAGIKRTIVRVQPYLIEAHAEIKKNIKRFADAGAYGVIFEGMKFSTVQKGLVKVGGDLVYPVSALKPRFAELKRLCHDAGLKFYSGENRLRAMGDSLCCCGIDGLNGFCGNTYNVNHFVNGDATEPTPAMQAKGSAKVFNSLYQDAGTSGRLKNFSFCDCMASEYKRKPGYYKSILSQEGK